MKWIKNKPIVVISLCCVLCAVLIFSIWYSTRERFEGVYTGMSTEEFREIIPKDRSFGYCNYIFYDNQYGDSVVGKISDDYQSIVELQCFDKHTIWPNRINAKSISPGMNVYNVVSKLGTPYGSFTSGMLTLAFRLNDGSFCVVYFNNDREMLVTSVVFREG